MRRFDKEFKKLMEVNSLNQNSELDCRRALYILTKKLRFSYRMGWFFMSENYHDYKKNIKWKK